MVTTDIKVSLKKNCRSLVFFALTAFAALMALTAALSVYSAPAWAEANAEAQGPEAAWVEADANEQVRASQAEADANPTQTSAETDADIQNTASQTETDANGQSPAPQTEENASSMATSSETNATSKNPSSQSEGSAAAPAAAKAATNDHDPTLHPEADTDFYAVLHEDGSLVFQAQPSDEAGAINYKGSRTASYLSGKAPWLASAKLIESVRFDESFASIRPESLQFWFIGCSNLKTIDLENLDASASTSMRSMFSGCSSLSTIKNLDSFDTSSSTYFGAMFRNCSSLTSLDVSHFDATHVGVLCFMFAGCTNLETLNMAGEGWRTSSLFLMVHVWENCKSLKSLNLSYLDTSGVHSMAKDFNGCSSLEYLDLSGADTSSVGSLEDMFGGCDKLATVKLGPKFTFNGMSDSPQCSLPAGVWKSEATGTEYASADVPNFSADTYTRISSGESDDPDNPSPSPSDPSTDPTDTSQYAEGEYQLANLKSNLGMFNHFVDGSQKLSVTDDRVTLSFITDGGIQFVQKVTKVAIGPSSKLVNTADMVKGESKYANSLVGNPMVFEGTLVSAPGEPKQYAFDLEFPRSEFEQMVNEDGGIYLTLFQGEKGAWHKGDNDLIITWDDEPAPNEGDEPAKDDPAGIDLGSLDDSDNALPDGTYDIGLNVSPSMVKLAGHDGLAPEPKLIVSGDNAYVVVNYRSSLGSAWRYGQMAWGSYDEVSTSAKDGIGAAPTFKEGKSAADGMNDDVLEYVTFALPLTKAEFIDWAVSGKTKDFTARYVKGYNAEHDGDWWKALTQPTMEVTSLRAASDPALPTADYAKVLDVLSSIPEDLTPYTDESVKALDDACARVNATPLPASRQADVNAMAQSISDAIDALVLKDSKKDDQGSGTSKDPAADDQGSGNETNPEPGEQGSAAAQQATLTFDLDGGTLNGQTGTFTITANVGDTINLPGAPTKAGYTFKCWIGSEYAAGAAYKVEGDHTFTAKWEQNSKAGAQGSKSSTPATGDGIGMAVIPLAVAALIALTALVGCLLKRRQTRVR